MRGPKGSGLVAAAARLLDELPHDLPGNVEQAAAELAYALRQTRIQDLERVRRHRARKAASR